MQNRRFHAQRKHIISSLDTLIYQLLAISFLLSPAFLLALLRLVCQFQSSDPRALDSNRSLRFFYAGIIVFNFFSVWSHAWYGAVQGKSALLDFVGLGHEPTKLELLTLDASIIILQLVLVTISYETHVVAHGPETAPDTLLPTPTPATPVLPTIFTDDDNKPYSSNTHEPELVIDLTFSTALYRLRHSAPSADNAEDDGIPLPNTTVFPMPLGLRMLMRAQARARAAAARNATTGNDPGRGTPVPGAMDIEQENR